MTIFLPFSTPPVRQICRGIILNHGIHRIHGSLLSRVEHVDRVESRLVTRVCT